MKKLLLAAGAAFAFVLGTQAQNTSVALPPGDLAVFKAGDDTGYWNISTSRAQPCFVQVFDPVAANQAAPVYSLPLPTNAPNAIWINAHAGSEGGGISRAFNRSCLAVEGYTGDIISPTNAKPSSDTSVPRGFGAVDPFGNEQVLYSDLDNWFGLPIGVTQNNPTGIASADGTNFWGTGNVTGASSEAAGTLFYNTQEGGTPYELQNYIQAAAEARIIGGTLYVVVPGGGVFNFLDPENNNAVVPLPFDPNVPNPVEHVVSTNLFLNWGTTFQNIANFDMNAAGTIAYGADQTFGVVKFVNTNGGWTQAPYFFNATNIGTLAQVAANQGCFGICVDFTGANPIIYATTMENGTGANANDAQGNANQNRLIRIVDTGIDPSTNMVAETLATATTTNEAFRGIDFTPDLTPLITSQPAPYSTTNGGSAFFSVAAQSIYPLSYQWMQNSSVLTGETNATLALSGVDTNLNGDEYECVVTNAYGSSTSAPAALTVTLTAQSPGITNSAADITGYIGGPVTFASIAPTGTDPFTFQWYFGGSALSDSGGKYGGSLTSSLTVSNLQSSDVGSYYLVASNSAGFASNLVDVLSVLYHVPTVAADEPPSSSTAFVGQIFTLTATAASGTPPLIYQWYNGTAALQDANEYSGSATSTLTINPIGYGDAGSYTVVISNPGGSVTSQVATVTVLAPPAPSYVAFSNQVYTQNFNTLPDPGSNSVNSINNPHDPGSIDGNAYSLANPFDFAYPIITSDYLGGLGLPSMAGWYGAADTLYTGVYGISRFGAQDGDQTTGGVIDFGPNDNGGVNGTNRALGLLSTGTTGATTFALKLVNTSGSAISTLSLSFTGELWHNGTTARTMSFGYTEDDTATNFVLTPEAISNAPYDGVVLVSNLFFSFPTATEVTTVDGTQPGNQVDLATNSMTLSAPWQPGAALWLIWEINYYGSGSGNGYAIDNLSVSVPGSQPSYVPYSSPSSLYTQNFDSLPYETTNTVNAANPVTINGVIYSLANPFDFAYPITASGSGGLGLSATMPGWYGLGNAASQFGATAGDQTTGGILSFGPTNTVSDQGNRSLGLIATGSTGPTAFGVRFLNLTGSTLGQFSLAYSSELWRQTTKAKTVTNFYYIDLTGTNGFNTNIVGGSLTNLSFATASSIIYGTNGPVSSNYVVITNQALATDWPPGAALWVVWEMDSSTSGSQGLGIDNLSFLASLATNLAPVITTEPLAQSVADGQPASFTVAVSNLLGGGYQWYTNGAALHNGNEISGATSPTLSIDPAGFSDAATYTVVISNEYGSVTSSPVTLTVSSAPVAPAFAFQPQSQTNYVSSNTVLFASATGTQPITYQWQFDGSNISSATSTNLFLFNLGFTNAGTYTLVAANSVGTNTSQQAVLTVLPVAPTFLTEPVSQSVTVGGTATFSVNVGGTGPFQYQWMFGSNNLSDGDGITGSLTNTLTLTNVQFSQAGSYSVLVSNAAGFSNSTAAILTVVPGPSYVPYSNAAALYSQDFDSLPYEATNSVNTANPVTIDGVTYSVSNPFDFAFPVESTGGGGGLGLSNTMAGWYGLANIDVKLGATAGDQTTGGVLSFGPTNNPAAAANRSLGLLATSTTGPTGFGVKFLNLTGYPLSQFSLAYSSELWRQTTSAKTVTNFYYLDLTGTNGFNTNIVSGSLTNLSFAVGAAVVYGTNGPVSSNYVVFTNQAFTTNWPANAALWLIWEMDSSAGGSQGIGIDNLTFSAVGSGVPVTITIVQSNAVLDLSWPSIGGTNLQVVSDLTLTNGWTSYGAVVTTTGATNSVTVPITAGNQFFRLQQQ